jgi:hypothetical protein
MDSIVRRVVDIRRELASEVREHDPQRSAAAKRRQLDRMHELTAQLRAAADGVIATGLRLGGKPGKALDEAYENLAEAVAAAIPTDHTRSDSNFLNSIVDIGLTPAVSTDYERWQPLHWVLELPDVLVDHGGFDAIVGNPPFVAGSSISGAMGGNFRDWLVHQTAAGQRGNADLVAYFFLRAVELLRHDGNLGLIATNTIAQGDTREVGLDQMVARGLEITRAVQSSKWPVATANLEYAAVWGTRKRIPEGIARWADGVEASRITSLLEPAGRTAGSPVRLSSNLDIAFQGVKIDGIGFVIPEKDAKEWLASDPRYADVLFPYLSGEDMNSRSDCSPSRWVIDFYDKSEEEAARFERAYARVVSLVKPERMKNNRKLYRDYWWHHAEKRPGLRRAIAGLSEVLAITLHGKTLMPARVPTTWIFSHGLAAFATDSFSDQAVLSSNVHQMWAIKYGSGIRHDPRYTPSDVFETFPQPVASDRLVEWGKRLDGDRRRIMLRRDIGLTKLYNLVNNPSISGSSEPDVETMRRLHVELDEAVMAAYGWSDVPLEHGFHTYRQMTRWTVSPAARVEILDRLLEENLRRAAAQPKATKKTTRTRRAAVDDAQGTLL